MADNKLERLQMHQVRSVDEEWQLHEHRIRAFGSAVDDAILVLADCRSDQLLRLSRK